MASAKLVYQLKNNNLILAWDFNFYSQDRNHLWSIRINASNGELLEKHDLSVSCTFETKEQHKKHSSDFSFYRNIFKDESISSPIQIQGGSYRVIPFNYESPNHTTRQLISNPENSTASPKGWHDTNTLTGTTATLKYSYLRGNNTWSRADYGDINPATHSTTSTANGYSPTNTSLTFDFPYPGVSVRCV